MADPAVLQRVRHREPTAARACLIAAIVALLVRAVCMHDIPLLITNDGAFYIWWAQQLMHGEAVHWPPYRTPGYSLFLAAVFRVAGDGPWGVLAAQHLLGVLSAAGMALLASRLATPRIGLVCGLLVALDPVLLGFESCVLSESPAAALLLAAAALAIIGPRGVFGAGLLGGLLAALCLTRPAFQVVVPFFLLGQALRQAASWRIAAVRAAVGACIFVLACSPWLIHNARRGIIGFSGANSALLWIGVVQADMLDMSYPISEKLRGPVERTFKPDPASEAGLFRFLAQADAWRSREVQEELGRWARGSIAAQPGKYLVTAAHAALWQLDLYPPSGPVRYSETRWLMRRLGRGGGGGSAANFEFGSNPFDLSAFAMHESRGPVAWVFRRWASWPNSGVVRLVACLLAAVAVAWSLRKRAWAPALVLAGTLAFVGLHAAFLFRAGRFSMPCWILWWVAPAVLAGLWAAARPARGISGDLTVSAREPAREG